MFDPLIRSQMGKILMILRKCQGKQSQPEKNPYEAKKWFKTQFSGLRSDPARRPYIAYIGPPAPIQYIHSQNHFRPSTSGIQQKKFAFEKNLNRGLGRSPDKRAGPAEGGVLKLVHSKYTGPAPAEQKLWTKRIPGYERKIGVFELALYRRSFRRDFETTLERLTSDLTALRWNTYSNSAKATLYAAVTHQRKYKTGRLDDEESVVGEECLDGERKNTVVGGEKGGGCVWRPAAPLWGVVVMVPCKAPQGLNLPKSADRPMRERPGNLNGLLPFWEQPEEAMIDITCQFAT
ncbi:hypothetical protein R3P38DRAFT_2798704 [Favolaschia claudopus]|uniref:Uncharacterized protein n=1 Tax=Favolaschia claudopus TaxID=2862362 RepID=A0AAW0A141_9AGAR